MTACNNNCHNLKELTDVRLANVNEHISVGTLAHNDVIIVTPKVVFNGFILFTPRHDIIVEFKPLQAKQCRHTLLIITRLFRKPVCTKTAMYYMFTH